MLAGLGGFGTGTVAWPSPPADASLERRVESLEEMLSIVRDQALQAERKTAETLRQHSEALDQEKQTRAEDDRAIREKLADAQVGGLHVSAMGVTWLLIGLVLTTGSIEFAHWFGRC